MSDRRWTETPNDHEPLFRLDDSSILAGSLDSVVERLQRGTRDTAGYVLHRLLLVNYWHFDYQEILVPHGRLFLLGENGSGKSTILGATIPVILDGAIRPERLDTFGSTQRKIDHYVLGAAGSPQRRTSYVALEFAWHGEAANGASEATQPAFLTVGICFVGNADAQESVRAYRFVITSGKRLGIDIPLKSSEGRVHDGTYFRGLIRDQGIVTERQAEYRDLVARYLFGYAEPQLMEHLIDVLLLLRHPGLAGRLETFNDVYDRLKRALPPLPAEITVQTTEAFDRIDDLRRHGQRLQRQAAAAEGIYEADLELGRARLRLLAAPVVEAERILRRRAEELASRRQAWVASIRSVEEAEARAEGAERELGNARQLLANLRASPWAREVDGLAQELARAEELATLTARVREDAERTRDGRRREVADLRGHLGEQIESWRRQRANYQVRLTAVAAAAAEARWPAGLEVATNALAECSTERPDDAETPRELSPLSLPLPSLEAHRQYLDDLDRAHHEYAALLTREQAAVEALDQATERVRQAEAALAETERALGAAWAGIGSRLLEMTLGPVFDVGIRERLLAAAAERDTPALEGALAAFAEAAREAEVGLAEETEQLNQQLGELRGRSAELDEQIARLREAVDLLPARDPSRERARLALREAGIDARPLYSLIDFAPGLPEERRGPIERALLDAGLLDSLVLPDADAADADALLRARNLGDYRLDLRGSTPPRVTSLVVDPELLDPRWREVAARSLGSIAESLDLAERPLLALAPDGSWQHGALVGYSGDAEPLGFIGAASRRVRRQRALEAALAQRQAMQSQRDALETARVNLAARRESLRATERAVQHAADRREVAGRSAELRERANGLAAARATAALATDERASRESARAASERSLGAAMTALGESAPNHDRVRQVLAVVRRLPDLAYAAQREADRLGQTAGQFARDRVRLVELEERLAEDERRCREAREQHDVAETAAKELRERLSAPDLRDFQARLDAAIAAEARLTDLARQAAERRGEARAARLAAEQQLRDAEERQAEALADRDVAVTAFADLPRQQPDLVEDPVVAEALVSDEAATADGVSDLVTYAAQLVSSDTAPESLTRAADQARNRRQARYDEERAHLVGYDLFISEDRDRVLIQRAEQNIQPLTELLRMIGEQIRENQLLLNAEEERLFKDYLCGAGLTAIHRSVQAAESLVGRINDILSRTPLGRERYELVIDRRADRVDDAPPLARHYALLRKDPLVISDEERRVLFEAVRASVDDARRRAEEGEGAFAEVLAAAFDYREWFSLALYVTHATGERQRISSRTARQRSGAQQLFALYVPLFAALAALYESAAPWAPRLFAMDEAFDKVSEDNVTILLRFLVDLDFQWIVASPRLSGAGREVLPACADWQLFHDPLEGLAQAIPMLYWHGELYDPEAVG